MMKNRLHSQRGFVLPATLLLVLVVSSISVAMYYMTNTEIMLDGTDLDQTRAYYGAEAAMEKMIADLSALFVTVQSPTVSQIQALAAAPPSISNINYSSYQFDVPSSGGMPIFETRNISSGSNQGLIAQIIPMSLDATASGPLSSEVRMIRDVEVALIPVFQFGAFSDRDLSYFPGPNFDFGGRVHSNGDLYLATSASLKFGAKVSAGGEIIRAVMSNGVTTTSVGRTGPVKIPTAPGGCDGSEPACRDLQEDEGSKVGGPSSADNPNWINLSSSVYNGMVVNKATGAKELDLPFVGDGVGPIEIIRRPGAAEDPSSTLARSRHFNLAQIRIRIDDTADDLPGSIQLANVFPYFNAGSFGATDTAFAEASESADSDFVPPPDVSSGSNWPLIDGYLLVESRRADGSYSNVTEEWLNLGIARENPDAILKFQSLKDENGDGSPDYADTASNRSDPLKWLPLNLYDTREGEVRDEGTETDCAVGGIMNIVELEVNNLRRWLEGTIGSSGTQTEFLTQNGYILYFSDRRGMLTANGEYGFEDVINPADPAGLPNALLDAPEDVNGDGVLQTAGAGNLGDGFGTTNGNPTLRVSCLSTARKNRVSGARHGLKLINGGGSNLPVRPDNGLGGFTVTSENPVYVQGDYNTAGSAFGDPHAAAAILADAVTLLSNNWEDWKSFADPTNVSGSTQRAASTTSYRMAVAAGKNITYPKPAWADDEYGLDGGTHNFLRYLERWSGQSLQYRGSLVSLYFSQYAVGIYKCCSKVYAPPQRDYEFDSEFLNPARLPPGTPMFRDVVNLGFRQVF